MIKRLLAALLAVIMIFSLCSCGGLVDTPSEEGAEQSKFREDLLCGIFIYFEDLGDEEAFPTDDFDSDDAIKHYWKRMGYEGSESTYLSICSGGDGLADVKDNITNGFSFYESSSVEAEMALYYTAELLGAIMRIDLVFHTEDGELYTVPEMGEQLSSYGSSSHSYNQNIKVDLGGEAKLTYDCTIKLNTNFVDDLVAVKLLEYGSDGALIAEHEYARGEEFVASRECAYVVVEEEYEVSDLAPDHHKETKGDGYVVRSLINRGDDKTVWLKYPQGNGLVSGETFGVDWE